MNLRSQQTMMKRQTAEAVCAASWRGLDLSASLAVAYLDPRPTTAHACGSTIRFANPQEGT